MHFSQIAANTILINRYKIMEKLGQGANSCVYKALDLKTATFVAIKMLDPFLVHDPIVLERFDRECQILRTINHTHIIKVFDVLFTDQEKIMVMEYFESKNLKSFIKENPKLTVEQIKSIVMQLVSTLNECHRQGIVHRDIKPQNILINNQGQIKIVDFGVSKISGMSDLTKTGTMIGTPEYMAPEMFTKTILDFRTDIYSFGCVLYEMLHGTPPFVSTQLSQLLAQKMNPDSIFELPIDKNQPEWLQKMAIKCLRIDPILRYQSGSEILHDIEKSEKAMACLEYSREKADCLKCRSHLLPGFSFCYHCGTFQSQLFTRGNSALVIHQCEDIPRLSQFLGRTFKDIGPGRFKKELQRLPFFLLKGVETETAQILANEIIYHRAHVQIAKVLESEFKLSELHIFLALSSIVAIIVIPGFSLQSKLGMLAAVELLLFLAFRLYTKPLISKKSFQLRTNQIPNNIKTAVRDLSKLQTSTSKAIIGKLIHTHLENPKMFEDFEERIKMAFRRAKEIDTLESQLSQQSLVQLKTEIQRLETKIKTSKDLSDVELLATAKSALKTYYTLQENYADHRLKLLNLAIKETELKNEYEEQPTLDLKAS